MDRSRQPGRWRLVCCQMLGSPATPLELPFLDVSESLGPLSHPGSLRWAMAGDLQKSGHWRWDAPSGEEWQHWGVLGPSVKRWSAPKQGLLRAMCWRLGRHEMEMVTGRKELGPGGTSTKTTTETTTKNGRKGYQSWLPNGFSLKMGICIKGRRLSPR